MSADECPLSELPADQCACPRHRGGQVAEIETVGQPFEAWYPGVCVRCDGRIRPGQTIARVADLPSETRSAATDYVHVGRCP